MLCYVYAVGEDTAMKDNIIAVAREDFDRVGLSVRSLLFRFEFLSPVLMNPQLHKCCSYSR